MTNLPLNAYLARCGVGSRRNVVELITAGKIRVNNVTIKEPGHRVNPETDSVSYQGKFVMLPHFVYVLLNKPKDYITTLSDESGRKTVMDLVHGATKERIYPVGRLDRKTTGLLLFTNDGELTQQLTHPRFGIEKTYQVVLDKEVAKKEIERLKRGIKLFDGQVRADELYYAPKKPKNHVIIKLHSGKNRIVRRMFEHCGYKMITLDRIGVASLTKKGLRLGQWRMLTDKEVSTLKQSRK